MALPTRPAKELIKLEWDLVGGWDFAGDLLPVSRNGKWGALSKTGKVVIEPEWDGLQFLPTGLGAVEQNGKWDFIDRTNQVVMEPQWDVATSYRPSEAKDTPVYWLVAREEGDAHPAGGVEFILGEVLAKWLDADAKEIWSSR